MYMVTEELLNFIRTQFSSGMKPDEIERLLISDGGWTKDDVDEAMTSLGLMNLASDESTKKAESVPPHDVALADSLIVEEKNTEESSDILTTTPKSVLASGDNAASDDFLGIFESEPATPKELPSSEAVAIDAASPPSFELTRAVASASTPGVSTDQKTTPVQIEKSVADMPKQDVSLPAEKIKGSSIVSAPLSPVDTTSDTHFDFSAINKSSDTPPLQPPAVDMNDSISVLGKTIKTKSVAEAWLEGAQNSKKGAEAATAVSASAMPKEGKPVIHRTMGSDMLLRGTGAAISGVPSILPQEEKPVVPVIAETSPQVIAQAATPIAENIMRQNKTKKILLIVIVVILALGLIAGTIFFFIKMRGPDKDVLFDKVFTNFLASSTFGYKGDGMLDLALSTMTASGEQKGVMKFALSYSGALQNGSSGYGDGSHRVKLNGELQAGEFAWSTDVESDVRVVGNILYFHILALPDSADMDPSTLRTHWVKVNLSDIAKELALQGIAASQEGYGNFGGSVGDSSFNALIKRSLPFTVGDVIADNEPSTSVLHYKLKSDPDRMIALSSLLMRKYMNRDLVLTDEKKLRLKDAFAKVTGDIWVDSETNTLVKIAISGDFDDEMFDMHVKGPMTFSFDFSDFNKPVTVDTPTPILTLEELQMRTEEYKKIKEKRAHDQVKIDRLSLIKDALALYYADNKRYPVSLVQLGESGMLATSSVDSVMLKQYVYTSYIKDGVFTKVGRCPTKGKTCEYYHIGVNLDDVTNPVLGDDADVVTAILGEDSTGCGGEKDVACYDSTSSFGVDLSPLPEGSGTSTASTSSAK